MNIDSHRMAVDINAAVNTVGAKSISIGFGDALIVVDTQRDYLPGGALAVPRGSEVVEPLNLAIERFVRADLPIFYVRDWHSMDDAPDGKRDGRLPPHCIAGTPGAEFAPHLWIAESDSIIPLTVPHGPEGVSAFQGTQLEEQLRRTETRRIFIGGLALEHCVKQTVFDALVRGYEVYVLLDAVRAVDASPGDGKRALRVMQRKGARTVLVDAIGYR